MCFFAGLRFGRIIYSPLGLPGMGYSTLPIAAFVGSVISTVCVIRLSKVGSKTVVANMLLAAGSGESPPPDA